jgi:hypothetical protein
MINEPSAGSERTAVRPMRAALGVAVLVAVVMLGGGYIVRELWGVFQPIAFDSTPEPARFLWLALTLMLLVWLGAALLSTHPRTARLAFPLVFWSTLGFVLLCRFMYDFYLHPITPPTTLPERHMEVSLPAWEPHSVLTGSYRKEHN